MERPYILHMFTPGRQMSPFDINMSADAGYQIVVPYSGVDIGAISALTQDVIFSRGPTGVSRTGIFIGGRDAVLAADMLDKSVKAMVKPFVVSVMADPSGAYTTAAAMIACVEAALQRSHGHGLEGQKVVVIGGAGPVGRIACVIAAQAGARVCLSNRDGLVEAETAAGVTGVRFGVTLQGVSGESHDTVHASLADADVILACAAAGVQVLSAADLSHARRLKVAADVNAVPPSGIAGIGVMDNGVPLADTQAVGIGALAIGNVKYQTQHRLLVRMHDSHTPLVLSFPEAFATARQFLQEQACGRA
ncbi:MAG TPA: methylenetetrahydromethanopterin dehydrogenase [Burkholderiaceae bacterium]|nr:methylenetetrahydromethanopterin dehydrogenase [Burkholderiaceae bacterium]